MAITMATKTKRRKQVSGGPAVATRHFPRKGERFIDGEWVIPTPKPERTRHTMTAADRRNWFRKQAGWPPLREG